MSTEAAISVCNISKVYDLGLSGRTKSLAKILRERARHPVRGGERRERFHALKDVSFDVAPGETIGIIGGNGAGKSTLLKILSRITPPSAGHIDMTGSVGSLLEVGTGFHPELTGIENVYLNGTILGMSRREINGRLDEIIEFAEVDKFLETPVKRWSSGMRVRLAFAVAAHLDPEILIIDEVLSVGDYGFQAKCLEKMRSLATTQGRTVLYVSHQLATVEHLCPRAMLLVAGRLVFDGPTRETLSTYLQMFPHAERGTTPGVFDLAAADRGEYTEVLKRLEFRPEGGLPSDTMRMGDRVRVEIALEGLNELRDPMVLITVGSGSTPILFRMTSMMLRLKAAHPRTPHEVIVIDIPSLPLTPGEYHMDIQLKDQSKTIDFVRNAAEFSVIPADILGHGYRFEAQHGFVEGQFVVPWEWEIRPASGR